MDPETANGFSLSTEGRTFVEHAARGWAEAAVRAGDSADAANEAAANTIAFYTTDPSGAAEPPS